MKWSNERRAIRSASTDHLRYLLKRQVEIERECPNPTPRNATCHRILTGMIADELHRREIVAAAAVKVGAACS